MLDWESVGLGSIPTRDTILSLEFFLFAHGKDETATIRIFVRMWKTLVGVSQEMLVH